MQYHITKLPKSEVELSVKLEAEEMRSYRAKALAEAGRSIEIEGFRKGKAPAEIVKKKVGEARLAERASVLAMEKTYPEIIKELSAKEAEGFEPIGAPEVRVTKMVEGGPLEYKARLAILPEIRLPDYKNIAESTNAEKRKSEVAEEEIEKALLWLRDSRASLITVARPAEKGDRVEIDFEAGLNGATLENGKSQNHPLIIGEGKFMPGFEEELIGMKADEEKRFSVEAPKDYIEPGLAGKKLDFTVQMKLIQEKNLPELSDEFAKGLGNFDNLEALRNNIREGLAMEKEEKERSARRIKIVEAIAAQISAELPDLLINRELDKMTGELRSSIERTGMQWPDYLGHIKKSEEALRKDWEKDAVRRVKIALVLRKIGRVEKIEPTEEEIREATTETVSRVGINGEEFKKIDRAAFLEYNTTIARNEKVFKFLENLT
ncbi:MAG: trigger factor [Candidatus Sungiibacteriota bacterium]